MVRKLISFLTVSLFFVGCHFSAVPPSGEIEKDIARVKINQSTGGKAPIPMGDGLTIVNFFDEFSTGCPTGNRFETMERVNSFRRAGTKILFIFSDKHFSAQDITNFKAILPMAESLVQGDIEPIRPQLTFGKLLVVFDSTGNVIWREKPGTSEQQVFSELSRLMESSK